jgi:hypothetical protein
MEVLNWLRVDSTGKQKERNFYDIGQLFCMSTDRREIERSRKTIIGIRSKFIVISLECFVQAPEVVIVVI